MPTIHKLRHENWSKKKKEKGWPEHPKFIDIVNIYRTRHPTASEYTFKAYDYFTMINYMLIYKTSKNIF